MNTQNDSMAKIRKLADGELAIKARLGYVALMLLALAMTTVIISLWFTEPYLPLRAQLAFGTMTLIGASWVVLSLWALTTRRILLARDRVIAGRMAVTFASFFVTGAIVACVISRSAAAFAALLAGLVMLAGALRILSDARRRFTELHSRRVELEGALATSEARPS
jgi:flagellar biosynthesis component FlhA